MSIKRYIVQRRLSVNNVEESYYKEHEHGDVVHYQDHLQVVKELEDRFDSLKCCNNCDHYNDKVKDFCNLTQTGIYDPSTAICKNWQPKEQG